jgi:hypothetical protein
MVAARTSGCSYRYGDCFVANLADAHQVFIEMLKRYVFFYLQIVSISSMVHRKFKNAILQFQFA